MLLRIFKGILIFIAALIALTYVFGYNYIFRAISKTYLHGKTSPTIDDADYFSSHTIAKGESIPWPLSSEYNKQPLPKALQTELENTNSASFLVIKNGELIHEQYWDDRNRNSKTNSFSMAKAVTVLLVAKAIEEKKIKSFDEKFSVFFDNYKNVPYGKDLTLKDLAQMEAGLNWTEDYKNPFAPNAKAYYGKSLEEAVFLRRFNREPGTKFEYQSGATQLLGFALRKQLRSTLAEYASQTLWQPLGMEQNASWSTDDFKMEKTFCCINAASRDFAKLGQLFLNDGEFHGKQIIGKNLIDAMRTPTAHSSNAYGMGLWINNDNPVAHYYFRGLYGQYIIVIPQYAMVIVRTAMNKNREMDDKNRPKEVAFMVNETVKHFH